MAKMIESELLEEYYYDGAKKLHRIVDRILRRFGGITQKDYDDFYSLANEVFAKCLKKYDGVRDFKGLLYTCLLKKIISEVEKRNHTDRCKAQTYAVSLDMPLGGEESVTVGDTVTDHSATVEKIIDDISFYSDARIRKYFEGLSSLQRKMVKMLMDNIPPSEIRSALGISHTIYNDNLLNIRSYERTRILQKEIKNTGSIKEEKKMEIQYQTLEKSKSEKYSVYALLEMMKEGEMNPEHPLQRQYGQWQSAKRDNLIATVLNDYPIPEIILAEQIKPNGAVNWLIDGKQRLSYLDSYRNNGFKIGRNAERTKIRYKSFQKDEKGNKRMDKDGCPVYEMAVFDLSGKYYKDLPKELKKVFNNFNVNVTQFLNCTDTDIEYHIRRYNAGRAMSPSQNGITHIGEENARAVKDITGNHIFFKEIGNYRYSEFSRGIVDRVVIESMMAMYFLPDWKKKPQEMCAYIKDNMVPLHFESFRRELDRLAEVVTRKTAVMFNAKDSFLWFALFHRFTQKAEEDKRFIQFMEAFQLDLRKKSLNGISCESLESKGTKDKNIVVLKLNLMEALMDEFLKKGKES